MAFLSATGRFGPDLDPCRKILPNPSTYDPVVKTIADGAPFHTTSRYGTIGPHCGVRLELHAAASPAAKLLAAVETTPTSINAQRRKTPTPWDYTPTVQGQFARVLTVSDLEDRRKQRLDAARRTQAGAVVPDTKPEEVQHLALGPGTYEVDKDWNLAAIAVPFSFSKEPRRGILECSVEVKDLHTDARRVAKYDKRLSADQRRRSETALQPLRRATDTTNDSPEIAVLSKELARSYAELHRSALRIERKLASPVVRSEKFQRFGACGHDVESFRRGPGSYLDREDASTPPATGDTASLVSLDEAQRQELEKLLARESTRTTGRSTRKPSTFGRVKHRDMLTSMTQAGHLSAVAVADTLGPGVYDMATSAFHVPSHNLLYKAGASQKRAAKSKHRPNAILENQEKEPIPKHEIRERWRALRHGPVLHS